MHGASRAGRYRDRMAGSSVTDLAGRVLAGRYRLVAPIGTGASGRVYLADDTRLRRRVAVKVLHAALADDSGFLRRFRAEAQVAASLHHPNIMTVHDWGEDAVPFMVLEYLAGGSLRAMLDDGARLSPAQAARVGRDVAGALEYAHTRGIVHRDVKPANLLFDEHGIVRVADFGLARALAEASWTEPAGAVLGTARYASPEQAMGVQLDGRSDLYSLALVLVEAVTGRVPFAADTTIGTLAARTQRPVLAPPELGPLAAVVERAGRLDVDERYPDAATMRSALDDVVEALPPAQPLVLPGATERSDPHPTQARIATRPVLYDQDAPEVAAPVDDHGGVAGGRRSRGGARRRLVPFVVFALVALALVGGAVALGQVGGGGATAVPGLVGRSEADARAVADRSGLDVRVAERRVADDPVGTVLEQRPAAGDWIGNGHAVRLVVSSGPAPVEVPKLVGLTAEKALLALQSQGLVAKADHAYDEKVPAGSIVSQDPPGGEEAAPDSTIMIVISDGHAPVPVPDVAGKNPDEAEAVLREAGFETSRAEEFSDVVEQGLVARTDPTTGAEAPYASTITVYVSKGPDLVDVPRVVGMRVEAASDALEAAGLRARVEGDYRPGARVRSQDPDRGERARRGSTVTLGL